MVVELNLLFIKVVRHKAQHLRVEVVVDAITDRPHAVALVTLGKIEIEISQVGVGRFHARRRTQTSAAVVDRRRVLPVRVQKE
jgi:hypothetical protein